MRKRDYQVVADDHAIRCIHPDGTVDEIAWGDLQLIAVETRDCGPFLEDVYFVFEGPQYAWEIAQSTDGLREVLARLYQLPGFDNEQFSAAMCCTENARFLCWRRPTTTPPGA